MNKPVVFIDYHQADLAYSLQLLFEKRLSGICLRPIGLDWHEAGYWKVYDHPDTAEQYLGMRQGYQPVDGTLPLNKVIINGPKTDFSTIYYCEDLHNNAINKAITLSAFKEMDIDIVIASIPQHIKPYKELATMKGAKFIFQMGNVFDINLSEIPNLMANTMPANIPSSCHAISYHQEFLTDIFKPSALPPERLITSFINIYERNSGYTDFVTLKAMLPEYEFKSYGAQCQDGIMNTTEDIATMMQRSYFGFHSKAMGDGYGHILYNWFACGKPVITRISDYKGKLGEELLEHEVTCLDLDKLQYNDVISYIRDLPPEKYDFMAQSAYQRFVNYVNFDAEEIKIRKFLENLQ